jgi:hypothetical protein
VTLVDVDLGEEDGFELAELLHRNGWPAPVRRDGCELAWWRRNSYSCPTLPVRK